MSTNSKIEWTDATWNPMVGCTKISPGCANCYAVPTSYRNLTQLTTTAKSANGIATRDAHALAVTKTAAGKVRWTGKVGLIEHRLSEPLGWKTPKRIFVNSKSDLFHEDVPDRFIDKVFAVMALTPQHTYQILTKRPERMAKYLTATRRNIHVYNAAAFMIGSDWSGMPGDMAQTRSSGTWWPLPNVWLGASVEDQKTADERIPHLEDCPAALRFISYEPALGPVDWAASATEGDWHCPECNAPGCDNDVCFENDLSTWRCHACGEQGHPGEDATWRPLIGWLIDGGESGADARPSHPDWHRAARDWCVANGVPFFFKQWGEFVPRRDAPVLTGKAAALAYKSGEIESPVVFSIGAVQEYEAMYRVGKKAAGRLLDGVEHSEYPDQGAGR